METEVEMEIVRLVGYFLVLFVGPEGVLLEHRGTQDLLSWEGAVSGVAEGEVVYVDVEASCSLIPSYVVREHPQRGPVVERRTRTCSYPPEEKPRDN